MFRCNLLAKTGMLAVALLFTCIEVGAWDRPNCVHRPGVGRYGYWSFGFSGHRAGYVPEYQGELQYKPNGELKRYFDSTGRWTGDGYDSMSTAKPNVSNYGYRPY